VNAGLAVLLPGHRTRARQQLVQEEW